MVGPLLLPSSSLLVPSRLSMEEMEAWAESSGAWGREGCAQTKLQVRDAGMAGGYDGGGGHRCHSPYSRGYKRKVLLRVGMYVLPDVAPPT